MQSHESCLSRNCPRDSWGVFVGLSRTRFLKGARILAVFHPLYSRELREIFFLPPRSASARAPRSGPWPCVA